MSTVLKNYLQEAYLNDNRSIVEMLDLIKNEQAEQYINLFGDKYNTDFKNERLTVKNFGDTQTELNHTIFAQKIIDEIKTGYFNKSAQLLLRTLRTQANNGNINPYQLSKIFKSQQGLIEVPIHLILYIGGLYDFYYHEKNYAKDELPDNSKLNGIIGNNGKDILDNDILKGVNIPRFIFENDKLKAVTAGFTQPITPKFVDDHLLPYDQTYEATKVPKNYTESYFDYDLNANIPVSNNISSQMPVYGYGNLNNYLNTMSYFFFNKGLDGGSNPQESLANQNGVPYHIIGNFNGKLKTFKTYDDPNINFLASYNSYSQKVKYDLTNITSEFNNALNGLVINDDFLYGNTFNNQKISLFLILSKIKSNFIGGYLDVADVGNIIRGLCASNNLLIKQNGKDIPDFIGLLLYMMFQPSGKEPSNPNLVRPNKQTKIIDKYHVDINGYNGYIDNNGNYVKPEFLISDIDNYTGTDLHDYITRYLINQWSKEFNSNESNRLKALDDKGVFVVYPSYGGDVDFYGLIDNTITDNTAKDLQKTNVVSRIITDGDRAASQYINDFRNNTNFISEDKKNKSDNIIGFDFYTTDQNLVFNYANNRELYNLIEVNPNLVISKEQYIVNDNFVNGSFDFFSPTYYSGEGSTSTENIGYFDIYDNIVLATGVKQNTSLFSLNKNLIKKGSRLFWFEKSISTKLGDSITSKKPDGSEYEYRPDHVELKHYGFKGLYNIEELKTPSYTCTYKEFSSGYPLYTYFDNIIGSEVEPYLSQSDERGDYDNLTAKSLVDIFDVDKLEDFRALFNYFADSKNTDYMSNTFGSFNFRSLVKHTNIFGHKHLPNDITFNGKTYTKDELFALLTGYSGMFIDFASKTGLSRVLNTTLTLGQRTKAEFVIDEFMGTKITVNNYSTAGPLKINNQPFNPKGLRYSTALFEPIFAFSNQTRDYTSLSETLGDKLLFRTLLFGSQSVKPYSNTNEQDYLIKKYIKYTGLTKGLSLTLNEDSVISELTKTFFRGLNIELNEGNIQLLVTYVRNYIKYTLIKNSVLNTGNYDKMITYGDPDIFGFDEKDVLRYGQKVLDATNSGYEGEKDYIGNWYNKPIVSGEIINGEYVAAKNLDQSLLVYIDKFEQLDAVKYLNDYIKSINQDLTTKLLETVNTSFRNLKEKLDTSEGSLAYDPTKTDPSKAAELIDKNMNEAAYRDLKAGLYYRVKTLYDKNIAFNNADIKDDSLVKQFSYELATVKPSDVLNSPLFFNFNTQQNDICDDNISLVANEKLKDLFDYVSILDRGNNDYGTKVLVDIVTLRENLSDDLINAQKIDTLTGKSMWSILSKLASDHEFLLLPLSSYINLNGAISNAKGVDGCYELAHDMFGVFKTLDMWESNPSFIFQLGSLTSNIKDGGKQKNSANLGYDLSNTFCLDLDTNILDTDGTAIIKSENVPSDVKNSNISAFIVDFANQNQNMFKNIQISTEEFTNTEESIKQTVALASDSIPTLSSGKLFSAMESRSYSCTVTSLGNATIQPLSYFYLRNVPLFYGSYWITNVSHRITPNSMETTFKGVRQPITKKPTANATVITYLMKRAGEIFTQYGGLTRQNETPTDTAGTVYIDRGFTVTGDTLETKADTKGYGLVYQECSDADKKGKYVTYNGLWVVGSYLKKLTNGDETDTLLMKTFLSYLLNNAIEIARQDNVSVGYQFTDVGSYMIDVIIYDLNIKLRDGDMSLSKLISEYNTSPGDVYETLLTNLSECGEDSQKIYELLKANDDNYSPYKALITNKDNKVVGQDATLPKISFPSAIDLSGKKNQFDINTRVNAWVSDQTPSNGVTLHGFSTFGLTNLIFNTAKVSDGSEFIYLTISGLNGLVPQKMEVSFFDLTPTQKSVVFVNGGLTWDPYGYTFDLIKYLNDNIDPTSTTAWLAYKSNSSATTLSIKLNSTLFTGLTTGKEYYGIVRVTYPGSTTPLYLKSGNETGTYYDVKNTVTKILPANPFKFKTKELTGSDNVVLLGAKPNGDYNHESAIKTEYELRCEDPQTKEKYNVRYMGSWGKTGTKYVFLKNSIAGDENENDTIKRDKFAFIYEKQLLGEGRDSENTNPWTVKNKGSEQDNIYVEPATVYSSGSGLVYGKPVDKWTVTGKFGEQRATHVHQGLDMAVATGTTVYSSYDGIVVAAGLLEADGYGNAVIIKHPELGLSTLYAHLSEVLVGGDGKALNIPVKAGQVIGKSGGKKGQVGAGSSQGPHLHYEVAKGLADNYGSYFNLQRVDPEPYLKESTGGNEKIIGSSSDFWKLVTICAGENYIDQPQGMADVAQSIYNRVNLQGGYGKTITEVIMAEGQYEPTFKTRSLWQAIKDKETAIAAYMATKGSDRDTAKLRIETALNAITNKTLMANAATFVGSRTEFLAGPPNDANAVGVVEREPKAKNNAFFWNYQGKTKYYDTGNLAATKIPDNIGKYA